jgi:phosphoesterase RecJ-like protein
VAVLFREAGDKVKISFRSKGRVDVSQLAQSLGGGGHPNAAGAVISDTLDGTKADVLPKAKELVRNVMAAGAI